MTAEALVRTAKFAHRGLWRVGGPPENALCAFEAACAAGHGVELDARLSADGEAIVFHDEALDRMTAESGLVEERTADDLTALRLLGSAQTIPTLAQALAAIAGRTPVLIELKTPPGREGPLEQAVAALLAGYDGPGGVVSFNPAALLAFGDAASGTPSYRGLNCDRGPIDPIAAKADFLSASLGFLTDPQVQAWREQGGLVVGWTFRSRAQLRALAPAVDGAIFEGFDPWTD